MLRTPLCALVLTALLPAQEPDALRVDLQDSANRELKLYRVRAHVDAILDLRDGVGVLAPEDRRSRALEVAAHLRDAVRAFVEPPLEDGEQVEALGHEHLSVLGRPAQHAWVERFLKNLTGRKDAIATIDAVVLKATPEVFEDLEIGGETRVLDGEAAAAFRAALVEPDGAPRDGLDQLNAPRLSLQSLQRAEMSALEQVAYLRDYDIEALPDGSLVADPKVDTVEAGMKMDGSFVAVDEKKVGVTWHVRIQDLKRPIPEFETTIPGTKAPLKIQLPQVQVVDFGADVALGVGALAVVPGPELRGDRVVLLLSVSRIE